MRIRALVLDDGTRYQVGRRLPAEDCPDENPCIVQSIHTKPRQYSEDEEDGDGNKTGELVACVDFMTIGEVWVYALPDLGLDRDPYAALGAKRPFQDWFNAEGLATHGTKIVIGYDKGGGVARTEYRGDAARVLAEIRDHQRLDDKAEKEADKARDDARKKPEDTAAGAAPNGNPKASKPVEGRA